MDCECLPKCPFFHDRMQDMPASALLMKRTYCQDDWHHCARYMVFKAKGSDAVPIDLYPTQVEEARRILR